METISFKARYVFPVHASPVADGVVSICGDRIVDSAGKHSEKNRVDLGNVAILPGLVNAHTHLEFSHLKEPLGACGNPLPTWIMSVIASRREQLYSAKELPIEVMKSVQRGLSESSNLGTTALGEMATTQWPENLSIQSPIDCTIFLEVINLSAKKTDTIMEAVNNHVQRVKNGLVDWKAGISPHAPYTVHPELVSRLSEFSAQENIPLAMHLAESQEELELLRSHSGPFLDLLKQVDAWDPTAIALNSRPMDYLKRLAKADRALIIHGNYLSEDEIEFLAGQKNMSVVYCPRTHAYFQHEDYPLAQLLSCGAQVALGTDSRASNPDLSLLEEMRFIAMHHPAVRPEKILELGTLGGALALGQCDEIGTLKPGSRADFTVVELAEHGNDPYELLFDSTLPVVGSYCRGKQVTTR